MQFADALAGGKVETVDLTHTLDPDFPVIVLPPEFGQCARFRVEEVSRYDDGYFCIIWNVCWNISLVPKTLW